MVAKIRKETRPKRTKSSKPNAALLLGDSSTTAADNPLPTAEALAVIAANVSKGTDLDPRLAVDYALKLWQSAREKLAGETNQRAVPADNVDIPKSEGSRPASDVPAEPPAVNQPAADPQPESPSTEPAKPPPPPPKAALPTFETFLRTVVKGASDADSEQKFRAFLRSKFPEPEADEQLARLNKEGFKDIGEWLNTSREFRDWSKSEKSS